MKNLGVTLDLFKIIGIGIITTVAVLTLKQIKTEYAVIVGLAGSVLMLILIINQLTYVISYFTDIVAKTNLDAGLFGAVLKIVGVGYLTEFAANICTDAGSAGVADKILLGGKVVILYLALPIITSLLNIIIGILP